MSTAQLRARAVLHAGSDQCVRVLLVDDDADYGTIIRRLLRRTVWASFEVTALATANEAMAADPDTYDVVLLDYQLGGGTGLDVLRWWRARGSSTPVILLTAMGGPTADLAASEAGAFDYLDKADLEPRILERAIRYAMLAAEALRAERLTAQMQSAVARAGRALLDVLDQGGLADQVARVAVEELGADASWFGERQADGTLARVATFPIAFPAVVPLPEAPDGTAAERAIRSGRPVIVDVMGTSEPPSGSAAVFPLVTPERVAGVLAVFSRTPRFFTVPVAETFATYASQAALAFRAARLQQQLQDAVKMDATGRLAGGVAHEFNNLMTAILGHADLLIEGDLNERQRAAVEAIHATADRAAIITHHLLAFSRRQVLALEFWDLSDVVRNIEPLLDRLVREHVHLVTVRNTPVAPACVDRVQVEHVLLNLAMNARDAMPAGGTLVICTQVVTVREPRPVEAGMIEPGTYVELSVTDTGEGMDAATKASAFEPFFTTRATGQAAGLGLASVFGIVQQSGGRVALESAPGRGTTVTLYFPWAGSEVSPPPDESSDPRRRA